MEQQLVVLLNGQYWMGNIGTIPWHRVGVSRWNIMDKLVDYFMANFVIIIVGLLIPHFVGS